jgi:predicted outer membrane repeat protein
VTLTVKKSSFAYGLASQGGAAYISGLSSVSFESCSFSQNYATSFGGAVYASGYKSVSFTSTTFSKNDCTLKGGDVFGQFSDYYISFSDVAVSGTTDQVSIYGESVYLKMDKSSISSNEGEAD